MAARKRKEEKLVNLKVLHEKKLKTRNELAEEIKEIASQIKELEDYFLLQDVTKLKDILKKKGVSIKDIAKAIEDGTVTL